MARSTFPDFSRFPTYQVLQRLSERDSSAEAWLWNTYRSSVTRQISGKITGSFREVISADECFTEAWLDVVETLREKGPTAYAAESNLGGLLYRIAHRKLLRLLREKEADALAWGNLGNTAEGEAWEDREKALDLLWRELRNFDLSDEQRTYVELRFYDLSGKIPTNEELARELNRLFPRRNPPFIAGNLRGWFGGTIVPRLRDELVRRLRGQ